MRTLFRQTYGGLGTEIGCRVFLQNLDTSSAALSEQTVRMALTRPIGMYNWPRSLTCHHAAQPKGPSARFTFGVILFKMLLGTSSHGMRYRGGSLKYTQK